MQNFCTLEVQNTLYYNGESDGDTDIDGAVQCSAVQCSAVQCSALCCSTVQCSTVQCNTVQPG